MKSGFAHAIERIKEKADYDLHDIEIRRLITRIEVEGKVARKLVLLMRSNASKKKRITIFTILKFAV
jgi:hypothetical protein